MAAVEVLELHDDGRPWSRRRASRAASLQANLDDGDMWSTYQL